jgi:[acyl-carrier-protein] S-malonyltransferase
VLDKEKQIAYVFPGQGSQIVGMGYRLYNDYQIARAIFDKADKALGFSLSRLCFEGPESELVKTINVQPAILTVSIACLTVAREMENNFPAPKLVAGHSLGEYTALVAAGSLNFNDAVKLVRERGRLMYEAGQAIPGSMIAVMGLNEESVSEICSLSNTQISNINSPGQIVISGSLENLESAKELINSRGGARVIPLKVSGAFHSKLMEPAAKSLKEAILKCKISTPAFPIVANINAEFLVEDEKIKLELTRQLVNCVRWQKCIEKMVASGITNFIEIGSGQVLSNLIKRIDSTVSVFNISDREINEQVKAIIKDTSGIGVNN